MSFSSRYQTRNRRPTRRPRLEPLEMRIAPDAAGVRFLEATYDDLLGRDLDPVGRSTWEGLLDAGVAREEVVLAITHTEEYIDRRLEALYQRLLGRGTDLLADHWAGLLAVGTPIAEVQANILGSPEYRDGLPGTTDFLDAVYSDVLGRDPGPQSGLWQGLLDAGVAHTEVARSILGTPEADQLLVEDFYTRLLHRPVGEEGLIHWGGQLQEGTRQRVVMAAIMDAPEYFELAQDDTDPTLSLAATPNEVVNSNITVTGQVSDDLSGVASLRVQVDDTPSVPVPFDANGSFSFTTSLLLEGSAEGDHTVALVAEDHQGNVASAEVSFTLDTQAPVPPVFDLAPTSDSEPQGDQQTTSAQVTLVGQTEPGAVVELVSTGATTTANDTGLFSFAGVPLMLGENSFTARARDAVGNSSVFERTLRRVETDMPSMPAEDTQAPVVEITSPADDLLVNDNVTVVGQVSDDRSGVANLQAQVDGGSFFDVSFDASGSFSFDTSLALDGSADGIHNVNLRANDEAGNTTEMAAISFLLDTVAPTVELTGPVPGSFTDTNVTVTGDVSDVGSGVANLEGQVDGGAFFDVPVDAAGNFALDTTFPLDGSADGAHTVGLRSSDTAGNTSSIATVSFTLETGVPDPVDVAPPLDRSVVSTLATSTSFLYTGNNPIQTGITPDTIEPQRAAVLRGQVSDRDGNPLPDVTITIQNHPEYGQTRTRDDGMFDLAVNGGMPLTLNCARDGFLPVQRQVDVPWQDYVFAPDVVMIPLDSVVTPIDLTAATPVQVAQGSSVSDADGTRQGTLLFPAGTSAEMVLPDGSTQALDTLNVRITEYTVGAEGTLAMPAELPPNSGYTYAVELSVDEAIEAGATQVNLSEPIPYYVENFLGFPVGEGVPTGFYDRQAGVWVASDDGLVIEIVAETNGLAELDIDGDGSADGSTALAGLGVTDAERMQLADLYDPGDELWRVPIPHFTPWDCNWPYGPPEDAEGPDVPPPMRPEPEIDDPCMATGSEIACQNQVLGETVGVSGTPHSLHYTSARVPGRLAKRRLDIPLSGSSVPASLDAIRLEVYVAGQSHFESFSGAPNQSHTFVWDGRDDYGRLVQGAVPITVRIGYVYQPVYFESPADFRRSFANFGEAGGVALRDGRDAEFMIWQDWRDTLEVGGWDATGQALGGWSVDAHHVYDVEERVLYLGTGDQRSVAGLGLGIGAIETVAGNGGSTIDCMGGPALEAGLEHVDDVAVGPDGSVYLPVSECHSVFRLDANGILTRVAGTGTPGFSGDGGLATEAQLGHPQDLAFGPDGSLYIVDIFNNSIRRVSPDGIITTVAGNGMFGIEGDGGPATEAAFLQSTSVAVGPDGSIYIGDATRVRKVGTDGTIETVAGVPPMMGPGDGELEEEVDPNCTDADGILATEACLDEVDDLLVTPDGVLYIADAQRVRQVGIDGIIDTVAGDPSAPLGSGVGGPATEAGFLPTGMGLGADGSLYIADSFNSRLLRVTPDGLILAVAGTGVRAFSGDGGPAAAAELSAPEAVAIDPNGNIYIADTGNERIRQITPVLPGFDNTDISIASADGQRLYNFNPEGRHLRTLNTLTGAVLHEFAYDGEGRLVEIEDGDGNATTILRGPDGEPTAIMGPFGQETTLSLNANGYLQNITDPAGNTVELGYNGEDGLLTSFTDQRSNTTVFEYTEDGLLTRDEDPAGGFTELDRTDEADGFTVTRTTAEGLTTTYLLERVRNSEGELTGEMRRLTTFPDGTQTEAIFGEDGRQEVTFADGTQIVTLLGPDPRFGMQAPVAEEITITTPGGLTQVIETDSSVTLNNPSNPLSLQTLTNTFTINGSSRTQVYEAATNTFTTTTAEGREQSMMVDDQGRPLQIEEPSVNPVTFTYDSFGRLENVAQGSGAQERMMTLAYDTEGHLSEITNPRGETTTFEHDATGRVIREVQPGGEEIGYAYDEKGNVTSITAPGRSAYDGSYSSVDLLEEAGPSDTTPITYTHNLDRQVTAIDLAGAASIDVNHDNAGRITDMTLPGGTIQYDYDPSTGDLATITAPDGGTLALDMDASLLREASWTGTVSGNVANEFNDQFLLASQSINGASEINFGYDEDRFLTQAGDLVIHRDPDSGYITETVLDGVSDMWSFDEFGELAEYRVTSEGTEVFAAEWAREDGGLITEKRETIEGTTTVFDYAYDANGRLSEVREDDTVIATYTYDANGNRLSLETPTETITATYDDQDRLLEYGDTTYTYTADGRLDSKTMGGQRTDYTYDPLGNLKQVVLPDGRTIDYVVDGLNRRIGKQIDDQLVQGFLYSDLLNPVAELDGAGNVTARFVYGTQSHVPDYMIKGGNTYRIVTDQLGSVRLVIDVATGDIAQRLDYDASGNVEVDTNPGFQPFGFAGGLYDRHTSLVRFGVRDYDPETGRWTTSDPGGFRDGTNFYEYVGGDPVSRFDPLGLQGEQAGGEPQPEPAPSPPPEPAFPSSGDQLRNGMAAQTAELSEKLGENFPSAPESGAGPEGEGFVMEDGTGVFTLRFEDDFMFNVYPPASTSCFESAFRDLQESGRDFLGLERDAPTIPTTIRN